MNSKQTEWAAQHDWFVSSTRVGDDDYAVTVVERTSGPATSGERELDFTSYPELRAWAGY